MIPVADKAREETGRHATRPDLGISTFWSYIPQDDTADRNRRLTVVQSKSWCTVCCTRHAPGGDCPGSLLATGPERHARKITAIAEDNQVEYYGILIAEAGDHWRARIFTYPDLLWRVPGGAGTVKFAGTTARDAESHAIEYVEEHCDEQGSKVTETVEDEIPLRVEAENADRQTAHGGKEHRHLCKLPIRFGEEMAIQVATTANFSAKGIYIATDKLVKRGKRLHMSLTVEAYTISLAGTVMWVRDDDEPGKPKGLGVRLERPPAMYLRYVEEVREAMSKS
jgi:Tfp pilus assembly protein PilZ